MNISRLGVVFSGALLVVGLLVSSACSTSSAPSLSAADPASVTGAEQIVVTVGDGMSFAPATFTMRAGQPVQLTLRNTGNSAHDFTLNDAVKQAVKVSTDGGQTASSVFTIDTPGTYTFECSMTGHAFAGMRGTITAV